MSLLNILDLTGALASATALAIIIFGWKARPGRHESVLILIIVVLTLTHDSGNYLEWMGITSAYDPIEDYMEVLTASLWGFFLYTFMQGFAEEKIRESEDWYRRLFDSGSDGIFVHGFEGNDPGKFVEVNRIACEKLGYTREELLGMTPMDIDVPEERPEAGETIRKLFEEGSVLFDRTHRRKDGTRFPVEINAHLFKVRGEERVFSTARDISRRVEAERKLQEIQELDDKILAGSPVAFVLHDENMKVIRVSSAYHDVTGFDPEEVIGKPIGAFMPDGPIKDGILERIRHVWETGERLGPLEIRAPKFEGKFLSETIMPIFDSTGRITNTMSVLEDITERKKYERALTDSEERYRMLFNSVNDGVLLYEIDENGLPGKLLEVNSRFCSMTGYSREELMEMRPTDLSDPDLAVDDARVVQELMEQNYSVFERVLVSKSGRRFPIEINAHTFVMGEKQAVLAVARDITDRKSAENRIKASLKEKEILLKEIHHRVKNNLQVISGLLNLQAYHVKGKKAKEVYKESQNRVITMALIHEELYQAKDLSSIGFADYIRHLTSNLFSSYGIDREKVQLNLNMDSTSMVVDTAIPLGLIVNELVSNALQHAFPDSGIGVVSVDFGRKDDGEFTLVVSDDGIGLPEKVDHTKTKTLGLQLVNILVEQLGGRIDLIRGEGTTFTISCREYREAGTEFH